MHTSHVLIPNRNIETYLTFEIARLEGIAANLEFFFLEDYLRDLLGKSGDRIRILERRIIQSLLISLFVEHDRDDHTLPEAVRTYLSAADGDPDERDLRRFQLASQLSRLFEEYSLSREEMLLEWRRGKVTAKDAPWRDTEEWQCRLWSLIYEQKGRLAGISEAAKQRYLCYGDAFDDFPRGTQALKGQIHFFGFSYISRTFSRILQSLSGRTKLCFYTINPCMEFWEDVPTPPETWRIENRLLQRSRKVAVARLANDEDPFDLAGLRDTPALKLWGRPGRENIHLLNSLTDCDFQPCFEAPPDTRLSLLRQIQSDILCREPERREPSPDFDFGDDRSVTVLACPGMQREVEAIANEIWSLVIADEERRNSDPGEPRLRFNDIAVIVADSGEFEAYKTLISSVFGEVHDIPHSITDLALSGESRVVEAVRLLLSLPLSAYTREDILGLLTHPAVLARFPDANPEEWVAWCEETGIFHGIDRGHHRETYIDADLYNWDQGIRRLALGAFMTGERSGDSRIAACEDTGFSYLPQDHPAASIPNAALFISVVRSLAADSEFARQALMTLTDWSDFVTRFIRAYIGAPGPEDERALSRCLAAVSSLREVDVHGTRVSFRIVKESVMSSLSDIRGSRGQYLASGVAISSFLPMRPIPFRVVFIAGMGEGRFPARELRDPLDLRAVRRIAGDVSPRERDQYMFLETLMSTGERLYLSYVSRDGQTGEQVEPSSVIKEFLFMVEQGYLGKDRAERLVVEHPLRRFDRAYFDGGPSSPPSPGRTFSPAARAEARAVALRESLKSALGKDRARSLQGDLREALPGTVKELLRLSEIPEGSRCAPEAALSLSLAALRRFLECPLQGWARHQLGIREEDPEDAVRRNDETFSTSPREKARVLRGVFLEAWNAGPPSHGNTLFTGPYERAMDYRELKGLSPSGLFRHAEKEAHLPVLEGWMAQLKGLGLTEHEQLRLYRFGRAEERAAADAVFGPIVVGMGGADSSAARAELHGTTEALIPDRMTSFTFLAKPVKKHSPKDFLRGFFDCLCLAASGLISGKGYRAVSLYQDGLKEACFLPVSGEEAEAYLRGLVAELTGGPHAYLLPIEAVLDYRLGNKSGSPLSDIVMSLRDSSYGQYSSSYGPVPHPEDYAPPEEPEALDMVERRFGLFFRIFAKSGKEAL